MYINYLTIAKADGNSDVHIISDEEAKMIVDNLNQGGQVAVLQVDEPAKDGQKVISRTINLKGFVSLNKVELMGTNDNPATMQDDMINLLVNQFVEVDKTIKIRMGTGEYADKKVRDKRGNKIVYYTTTPEEASDMYEGVLSKIKSIYSKTMSSFVTSDSPYPSISFDASLTEPAFIRFMVFNPKEYVSKRKVYDHYFYGR